MPRRPTHDHPSLDLESALDALFQGEPEGFIAGRDVLAKRLRAEGRRDEAARVKGLRRPSVAAWAVNQVARARRPDVTRLAGVGRELRRAQAKALSGGARSDRLRSLGAERRALVATLAEAALEEVRARGAGSESHRDDVVATFDAVAADPDAATRVLAGRLTRPLEAPVGFGLPEGIVVTLGDDDPAASRPPGARARVGARDRRVPRVHVLDAAEVRKARTRAARAHEALDAAEREVARLAAALATARKEAARARQAAARADSAAAAAESAAGRSGQDG